METLDDVARQGKLLRVRCRDRKCARTALFEPSAIAAFIGEDRNLIAIKFRCSSCGMFRAMVYPTPREALKMIWKRNRVLPKPLGIIPPR